MSEGGCGYIITCGLVMPVCTLMATVAVMCSLVSDHNWKIFSCTRHYGYHLSVFCPSEYRIETNRGDVHPFQISTKRRYCAHFC